ncbi:Repeat domain-containing protein [Chryseolinea serpens]|uniref:Repeat domain-containing protein n=1 Tax=Chryseolinea serpens TaxID=947013 RepID=A0A1M5P1T7_9BACT|nr:Repeat domain-containing protein [Chryseolinea serpens]
MSLGLRFFLRAMKLVVYIGVVCIVAVHSVQAQQEPLFELVPPTRSGVAFKNIIKETARTNALTYENIYNGGGVAIGDINNDGLDDLYLIANAGSNKLYLNLGNFKFKDITSSAGVTASTGWKTGVSMVDINADGLLDIYVCRSGKENIDDRRNHFFINQGNLTFIDKAKEMNLDDPSYSTQAAFFDYDKDGDLDVFLLATNVKVIRDLEFKSARTTVHPYAGDKLFRNDNGHFTDVTTQAGILSNALGFGLGIAVSDINKDGWPDLYVSNDYIEPDYLYINKGDGTFEDKLPEYLRHISHFSMGVDVSDINNDAWPDIYTLDMLPEDNYRQKLLYGPDNYEHYALSVKEGFYHQYMRNMLHLSNGNGTFSEIGQFSGISNTDWSWAPLFADYDNDGWKDLFVTNGYFRDYTQRDFLKYKGDYYFKKAVAGEKPDTLELASMMSSTPLHNYMFRNNGDLTFSDQSLVWGFEKKSFSNGAAFGDLDNDGDLDLVVNNQNESAFLYKNVLREKNPASSFLKVKLEGANGNTFGIGSKVYVYAGKSSQYFEQSPVRGYQSSVATTLHVGLGDEKKIDSVRVEWPSGRVSLLKDIAVDQVLTVGENDGVKQRVVTEKSNTVFTRSEPLVSYAHQQFPINDFKRQPLLSTMPSVCGPAMATADINGDGLVDVFVSGSELLPGKLFVQSKEGRFHESLSFPSSQDDTHTEVDAIFFDADNDNDQDLYVVSGGFHDYNASDPILQDRIYFNDGQGNFTRRPDALPVIHTSKSCARAADFDLDGDVDLFLGGRIVPGRYPVAPQSYLLLNDGHGHFSKMDDAAFSSIAKAGMITDALWLDLNNDRYPDLITVGEFMPVKVFLNKAGRSLEEDAGAFVDGPQMGLWSKLAAGDFDHDGDVDLIAGNHGLNSQFRASDSEMLELTYADFDKNGSIDPILTNFIQHQSYPVAGRDELLDQVYSLRKKFTSFESYAHAQLGMLFSEAAIGQATVLRVNELRTVLLENVNGKFVKHALPSQAQFAPIGAIEVLDYNDDGKLDILLGGNESAMRIRLGAIDANYGQLFQGDGQNHFKYIPQKLAGLSLIGDVKSLKWITVNGQKYLLAGINNKEMITYKKTN